MLWLFKISFTITAKYKKVKLIYDLFSLTTRFPKIESRPISLSEECCDQVFSLQEIQKMRG